MRVIDGDTAIFNIYLESLPQLQEIPPGVDEVDVGFSLIIPTDWALQLASGEKSMKLKSKRLRFAGINTPETKGASRNEGLMVRDYVRSLIQGKRVRIETQRVKADSKADKYGRYLARIFVDEVDLNQHLLDVCFAVPFMV